MISFMFYIYRDGTKIIVIKLVSLSVARKKIRKGLNFIHFLALHNTETASWHWNWFGGTFHSSPLVSMKMLAWKHWHTSKIDYLIRDQRKEIWTVSIKILTSWHVPSIWDAFSLFVKYSWKLSSNSPAKEWICCGSVTDRLSLETSYIFGGFENSCQLEGRSNAIDFWGWTFATVFLWLGFGLTILPCIPLAVFWDTSNCEKFGGGGTKCLGAVGGNLNSKKYKHSYDYYFRLNYFAL